MLELLLIRHGETDHNRQLRFQGQVDVPLNATGRAQAERLAARLRHEPISLVVCSDLQRAHATAEPLLQTRHELPTRAESLWREQAFGALEGLVVAESQRSHPELWAAWARHDADLAPPGGESTRAFHARVMQALQALSAQPAMAARAAAGPVAVFTHGGVLDMIWRQAHALPLAGPRTCEIPNTGINRVRWDGQHLQILQWADDAHLRGPTAQVSLT